MCARCLYSYVVEDGADALALLVTDNVEKHSQSLQRALGVKDCARTTLQEAFRSLSRNDALALLTKHNVPHCPGRNLPDMCTPSIVQNDKLVQEAKVFGPKIDGV